MPPKNVSSSIRGVRPSSLPVLINQLFVATQFGSLYAILPTLRDKIGASAELAGLILGAGYVGLVALNLGWSFHAAKYSNISSFWIALFLTSFGLLLTYSMRTPFLPILGRCLQGIGFAIHLIAVREYLYSQCKTIEEIIITAGQIERYNLLGIVIGPLIGVYLYQWNLLLYAIILFPFTVLIWHQFNKDTLPVPMSSFTPRRTDFPSKLASALVLAAALNVTVGYFESVWSTTLSQGGAGVYFIGISFLLVGLALILGLPITGKILTLYPKPLSWAKLAISFAPIFLLLYGYVESHIILTGIAILHSFIDSFSIVGISSATVTANSRVELRRSQGLYGAVTAFAAGSSALIASMLWAIYGRTVAWSAAALLVVLLSILSQVTQRKNH